MTEVPTTVAPTEPPSGGLTGQEYVGIASAILGNIMISAALNIQKYSHNKDDLAESKTAYVKRPLWWAGMLLMLFGELGNFLAYGLAPASVVAPLGTIALVTNAVIAPFVLKEKFRTQDLLGIVLSIGGAVVIVVFAESSEHEITPEELIALFAAPKFLAYFGATVVIGGACMYLSHKYSKRTMVFDMALVGIFGGYTVTSTKAVSTLLQEDILGMFTEWIFYVMLVVMIVTGVLQVRYIQNALQQFDSTEVIPFQFVTFTLGAIICSGIIYNDFAGMSAVDIILFCVGITLTFIGVWFITSGRPRVKKGLIIIEEPTMEERADPLEGESAPLMFGGAANEEPANEEGVTGNVKTVARSLMNFIIMGARSRLPAEQAALAQVMNNYSHLGDDDEAFDLGRTSVTVARPGDSLVGDPMSPTAPTNIENVRGRTGSLYDNPGSLTVSSGPFAHMGTTPPSNALSGSAPTSYGTTTPASPHRPFPMPTSRGTGEQPTGTSPGSPKSPTRDESDMI